MTVSARNKSQNKKNKKDDNENRNHHKTNGGKITAPSIDITGRYIINGP
jgi:hypothetical protein